MESIARSELYKLYDRRADLLDLISRNGSSTWASAMLDQLTAQIKAAESAWQPEPAAPAAPKLEEITSHFLTPVTPDFAHGLPSRFVCGTCGGRLVIRPASDKAVWVVCEHCGGETRGYSTPEYFRRTHPEPAPAAWLLTRINTEAHYD